MQRRDVLRLLTSSAVFSVMPLEAIFSLKEARAQVGQFAGVRTLNPHQNATLTTLCELIIPQTDTPGAKGARVNEFIDLLLTEWFDVAEAKEFLRGLDAVDALSRKRFNAEFIACTPDQQTGLMKQWDSEAMQFLQLQKAAAQKAAVKTRPQKNPPLQQNFFYNLKRLTLVGYYTSEIGFSQELGDSIIPPGHAGCAPLKEATR